MVASVLLCGHRGLEVFCRTPTLGRSQNFKNYTTLIINKQLNAMQTTINESKKLNRIAYRLGGKLGDRLGEKHIKTLKEQKIIKRIGSAKGGHWEIMQ